MPNYKEQTTSASITEWVRSFKVVVSNMYNQTPNISFFEERLQLLGGKVNNQSLGRILKTDMSDPNVEFNLLNPNTDEVIGKAKFADIYVILYSLYMHLAKKSDNKS